MEKYELHFGEGSYHPTMEKEHDEELHTEQLDYIEILIGISF